MKRSPLRGLKFFSLGLFVPPIGIVVLASPAQAGVLTFTFEGTASGTLGSASFPASSFSIVSTGDTANLQTITNGWSLDHLTSTISVSGFGPCPITSLTRTFVNNALNEVGFSQGLAGGGGDLIDGPINPAFSAWDLTTFIGPFTSTATFRNPGVSTNCGLLSFHSGTSSVTFSATPEPAGFLLLVLGLSLTRFRASRTHCVS